MSKRNRYSLNAAQTKCAGRELEVLMFALSVDHQWGIRELCYLLECLELPNRLTRRQQLEKLESALALFRERLGFGRVWTQSQLKRAFYAGENAIGFRRPSVQPMTAEEARAFGPSKLPRLDPRRVLRERVQVDLPSDQERPEPARARRKAG